MKKLFANKSFCRDIFLPFNNNINVSLYYKRLKYIHYFKSDVADPKPLHMGGDGGIKLANRRLIQNVATA